MSITKALVLCAAAATAACSGGGDDGGKDGGQPRPLLTRGLVEGAGNAAAPGGHRVVGGVLGTGAHAKSAQFQARGGIQP